MAKYAKMARWISPAAGFDVVVDVWKLREDSGLRDRLLAIAGSLKGVSAEFLNVLMEKEGVVGMLMVVGNLGLGTKPPMFAAVAQGQFDERAFVGSVRAVIKGEGNVEIEEKKIGDHSLFVEKGANDPFGFMFLDGEHLAVGSELSLMNLFKDVPANVLVHDDMSDSVLFGDLKIGSNLNGFLPPDLHDIGTIEIASRDGRRLAAKIPCKDERDVTDVRMFLEGIRSLLILQGSDNRPLIEMLSGIEIVAGDRFVVLNANFFDMLDSLLTKRSPASLHLLP